jgi:hypothetical protein
MLAKDPEHRFRSMDDVVAALKRLGPVFPAEPSSSLIGDKAIDNSQVKSTSGPQPTKLVAPQGSALSVPGAFGVAADAASTQPAHAQPGPFGMPAPESRPFPVGIVAAVATGVLLIAGALLIARKPAPTSTSTSATSTATPTATPTAVATGAAPSPSASPDIQTIDLSSLAPVASGAPKPAPAGAPAPPRPKPGPAAAVAPPAPAPHPAAPPPAAPAAKGAPDCNPSYYYDADGNKHFKPECFGH